VLDSVLIALDDPGDRIRQWERMAERFPEAGHAHHFLAEALAAAGRDAEAEQARAAAAAADPDRYGSDSR